MRVLPVSLEIDHRIDEVFQRPRTRQAAILGHVPDQPDAHLVPLGHLQEPAGHLAHLAQAAGGGAERGAPDGLDRVHDDHGGLEGGDLLQDRLQRGLGGQEEAGDARAQAPPPLAHLRQRLLAGDVKDGETPTRQRPGRHAVLNDGLCPRWRPRRLPVRIYSTR